MTADVDLLPLPSGNVAHLIAAQAAEIEALRAEVERLTFEMERQQQQYDERTACMIVHRGAALACSAAVQAAYSEEHERAERLAEALRRYGVHDQACVAANIPICTCGLDAALEQEACRG